MATKDLVVVLTFKDNGSASIKRVLGDVEQSVGSFNQTAAESAKAIGSAVPSMKASNVAAEMMRESVTKAGAGFTGMMERVESSGHSVARFGRQMSITMALVAGSLIASTRGMINFGDELYDLSRKTGTSTEALSSFKMAAEKSGTSLGGVAQGIKFLSRNMVEAQSGGKSMQETFKSISIAISDSSGKLRSANDVIYSVADAFTVMEDGAKKTDIAMRIFGRSGSELIPMLNLGSEGLKENAELTRRLGMVISLDAAKAADKFNDSMTELQGSFKGFYQTLAQFALPTISTLIKRFSTAIEKTKEWAEKHAELTRVLTQGGATLIVFGTIVAPLVLAFGKLYEMLGRVGKSFVKHIGSLVDTFKASDILNKVLVEETGQMVRVGTSGQQLGNIIGGLASKFTLLSAAIMGVAMIGLQIILNKWAGAAAHLTDELIKGHKTLDLSDKKTRNLFASTYEAALKTDPVFRKFIENWIASGKSIQDFADLTAMAGGDVGKTLRTIAVNAEFGYGKLVAEADSAKAAADSLAPSIERLNQIMLKAAGVQKGTILDMFAKLSEMGINVLGLGENWVRMSVVAKDAMTGVDREARDLAKSLGFLERVDLKVEVEKYTGAIQTLLNRSVPMVEIQRELGGAVAAFLEKYKPLMNLFKISAPLLDQVAVSAKSLADEFGIATRTDLDKKISHITMALQAFKGKLSVEDHEKLVAQLKELRLNVQSLGEKYDFVAPKASEFGTVMQKAFESFPKGTKWVEETWAAIEGADMPMKKAAAHFKEMDALATTLGITFKSKLGPAIRDQISAFNRMAAAGELTASGLHSALTSIATNLAQLNNTSVDKIVREVQTLYDIVRMVHGLPPIDWSRLMGEFKPQTQAVTAAFQYMAETITKLISTAIGEILDMSKSATEKITILVMSLGDISLSIFSSIVRKAVDSWAAVAAASSTATAEEMANLQKVAAEATSTGNIIMAAATLYISWWSKAFQKQAQEFDSAVKKIEAAHEALKKYNAMYAIIAGQTSLPQTLATKKTAVPGESAGKIRPADLTEVDWTKAQVSKQLLDSLISAAHDLGDGMAWTTVVARSFAAVMEDVGIVSKNVNEMWAKAGEIIITQYTGGFLKIGEAQQALGESFNVLISKAQEFGTEGSKAMLDFIRETKLAGLNVSEVTDYINAQLGVTKAGPRNAVEGLVGMVGGVDTGETGKQRLALDELNKAIKETNDSLKVMVPPAGLDDLITKARNLGTIQDEYNLQLEKMDLELEKLPRGSAAWITLYKQIEQTKLDQQGVSDQLSSINKQIDVMAASVSGFDVSGYRTLRDQLVGLEAEQKKYKDLLDKTPEATKIFLEAAGKQLVIIESQTMAVFNSMIANGTSFRDSIESISPALDAIIAKHIELGTEASGAMKELLKIRQVTVEHKELMDAIDGNLAVLSALANTGSLTQEEFSNSAVMATDYYNQLMKAGLSGNQALAMMAPTLERLNYLSKEHNLTLDEGTQKMIDDADKLGLLKKEEMSMVDVMMTGFAAVIEALGGQIPEAFKKMAEEQKKTADEMGDLEDPVDDTGKALDELNAKNKVVMGEMGDTTGVLMGKINLLETSIYGSGVGGAIEALGTKQSEVFSALDANVLLVTGHFDDLEESIRGVITALEDTRLGETAIGTASSTYRQTPSEWSAGVALRAGVPSAIGRINSEDTSASREVTRGNSLIAGKLDTLISEVKTGMKVDIENVVIEKRDQLIIEFIRTKLTRGDPKWRIPASGVEGSGT